MVAVMMLMINVCAGPGKTRWRDLTSCRHNQAGSRPACDHLGDEHEHLVIFACSGYVYARQLFLDLFSELSSTVGQFLSQPNPNRVAKFLTWVISMRLNHA